MPSTRALLATNHSLAGRSGSAFQVRYPNRILYSTRSLSPSSILCGAAEPEWAQQSAYLSGRTHKGMISSTNFMSTKNGANGRLQIHQSPRGIFINQSKYALDILIKHGIDKCDSIGTPMAILPKLDADPSGDKLVGWMSKKQDCTTMSTAKAEYVALSTSCAQVLWMRTHLKDYGFDYNKIPLYCDSLSAIAISCNPLADMFTKALSKERFAYLVKRLGMRCLTLEELEVLENETT
ncbi:hypothetical protein Tco_1176978 [Tanacetum coccineum]